MPVTLLCACGKAKRVKDLSVAARARCAGCGASLETATELPDDLDVVEDEPTPTPPTPAAKSERVAAPAAPKTVAEPPPPAAAPPKKKKKKKRLVESEETAEERLQRVREAEARVARTVRAIAFIVIGAAIVIGVVIMYTVYRAEMKDMDVRANVGAIIMGVMGVLAIGKGLIGLFLGQFLGDE